MPSLPASANRHHLPLPLCRGPVPPQSAQARPRPTLEDGGGGRAGSCKGAGIGAAAGIWGVRACSYMAVVMQQAHARSRARSGRHRPAVKRLRVPAHVTVQRCSARARHCPACAVPRCGLCVRWCRAFQCVPCAVLQCVPSAERSVPCAERSVPCAERSSAFPVQCSSAYVPISPSACPP